MANNVLNWDNLLDGDLQMERQHLNSIPEMDIGQLNGGNGVLWTRLITIIMPCDVLRE